MPKNHNLSLAMNALIFSARDQDDAYTYTPYLETHLRKLAPKSVQSRVSLLPDPAMKEKNKTKEPSYYEYRFSSIMQAHTTL